MAPEASMKQMIELLIDTPTVRAYRIGSDYQIECFADYRDEDFESVIEQLGLEGRTNYEWSYIPELSMEIIHIPMLRVDLPKRVGRTLSIGVGGITAALVADAGLIWDLAYVITTHI